MRRSHRVRTGKRRVASIRNAAVMAVHPSAAGIRSATRHKLTAGDERVVSGRVGSWV